MCLIVTKPQGSRIPKGKKFRRWFDSYPDGFGLAFPYQGRIRILKGAMNQAGMFALLDKMRHCLGNPQDVDIIFQFRAAVTGRVSPRFCHPFPVTKNQEELDSLDVLTDCALTHNGVIYDYAVLSRSLGDINDAQEFIKDYLVDMGDSLWNPAVQKLIEEYTVSKFALLSARGITYIGNFIEDNGCLFSNGGYKPEANVGKRYARGYGSEECDDYWTEKSPSVHIHKELHTEGGCQCDFCQGYHPVVYHLTGDKHNKDYQSVVCFDCFVYLEGEPPTGADVAF